jgi:hypothetical protein
MSNILEERQKNRQLLLQKVYEAAKVMSGKDGVNVYKVGEQLAWNTEETEAVFDYLQGEGLLQGLTVGGGIKLTPKGTEEVEQYPNKTTLDFSKPNIHVTITKAAADRVVAERAGIQIDNSRKFTLLIPVTIAIFFLVFFISIKPENVLLVHIVSISISISTTILSLKLLLFNQKS